MKVENDSISLLYEGEKCFDDGTVFNIIIIEHDYCSCIEIVLNNLDKTYEQQRIYLNSRVLRSKISQADVQRQVELIKNLKTNSSQPQNSMLESDVLILATELTIVYFILTRLTILVNLPYFGCVRILFDSHFDTLKSEMVPKLNVTALELTCPKPLFLKCYEDSKNITKNFLKLSPTSLKSSLKGHGWKLSEETFLFDDHTVTSEDESSKIGGLQERISYELVPPPIDTNLSPSESINPSNKRITTNSLVRKYVNMVQNVDTEVHIVSPTNDRYGSYTTKSKQNGIGKVTKTLNYMHISVSRDSVGDQIERELGFESDGHLERRPSLRKSFKISPSNTPLSPINSSQSPTVNKLRSKSGVKLENESQSSKNLNFDTEESFPYELPLRSSVSKPIENQRESINERSSPISQNYTGMVDKNETRIGGDLHYFLQPLHQNKEYDILNGGKLFNKSFSKSLDNIGSQSEVTSPIGLDKRRIHPGYLKMERKQNAEIINYDSNEGHHVDQNRTRSYSANATSNLSTHDFGNRTRMLSDQIDNSNDVTKVNLSTIPLRHASYPPTFPANVKIDTPTSPPQKYSVAERLNSSLQSSITPPMLKKQDTISSLNDVTGKYRQKSDTILSSSSAPATFAPGNRLSIAKIRTGSDRSLLPSPMSPKPTFADTFEDEIEIDKESEVVDAFLTLRAVGEDELEELVNNIPIFDDEPIMKKSPPKETASTELKFTSYTQMRRIEAKKIQDLYKQMPSSGKRRTNQSLIQQLYARKRESEIEYTEMEEIEKARTKIITEPIVSKDGKEGNLKVEFNPRQTVIQGVNSPTNELKPVKRNTFMKVNNVEVSSGQGQGQGQISRSSKLELNNAPLPGQTLLKAESESRVNSKDLVVIKSIQRPKTAGTKG